MTPAQCRAARAILGLTQPKLADAAAVGLSTLVDFERDRRVVTPSTRAAIQSTLESKGVIFVEENGEGPGVRLRKTKAKPENALNPKGPATDAVRAMDEAIRSHRASATSATTKTKPTRSPRKPRQSS